MASKRDTYKYWFKVGNLQVHCGITNDLESRQIDHQNSGRYTTHNGIRHYWKNGHISQVGKITTREAAMEWERQNGCNDNWG
jgi:predicted GIY-YIG superfamily endonuclease